MSRKKQVYEKITALYCRISLDDGGDNESMSISNQENICQGGFHPCELPLDYPSAKAGETVNDGAESAVYLDR